MPKKNDKTANKNNYPNTTTTTSQTGNPNPNKSNPQNKQPNGYTSCNDSMNPKNCK